MKEALNTNDVKKKHLLNDKQYWPYFFKKKFLLASMFFKITQP